MELFGVGTGYGTERRRDSRADRLAADTQARHDALAGKTQQESEKMLEAQIKSAQAPILAQVHTLTTHPAYAGDPEAPKVATALLQKAQGIEDAMRNMARMWRKNR